MLVGYDLVKIASDGADVAIDRPFVVVQDDDHALGLVSDVVERLERNPVGERGVSGHRDYVLFAAGKIARDCHSKSGRERCARMTRPVTVVVALSAQHKAVQASRLTDGVKAFEPAGKNLVDVGLMAYVEEQLVRRSVKDRVQGERELDHAQVWPR